MAREYKDSGIEWIGRIPREWKTCKLKRLLSFNNGQDYKHVESNEGYPVYGSGGVFVRACQYLYDGESILFGRKGTIDRPLYVNEKFWTVDTMYYAIPQKDTCGKYLYYLATLLPFNKFQTSTALPSMTQTILGDMVVVRPSLLLQQKIADYLDEKCGEIDSLISLQEQMIAQLTDYKQSVITEAVTKGLDPDAQLVPSGIEWIGDIPVGWIVCKMRVCVSAIGDVDHYMPESLSSGIPYVMTKDLKERTSEILFDKCKKISIEDYNKLSQKISVKKDDIIFARYATIGTICIVDTDNKMIVSYSCVIIRSKAEKLKSQFLFYYFKSKAFEEEIKNYINTNIQGNVGIDSLSKSKVIIPSTKEQNEIVEYLDNKCAEIDALIALKQQKIVTLKDYKKSLIYEAVTGKMEI